MKDIGEIKQAAAEAYNRQQGSAPRKLSWARAFRLTRAEPSDAQASQTKSSMWKRRREVLEQVIERQPSDAELAFFSTYCHDSYAGFQPFRAGMISPVVSRNAPWEDGGYLRYRTRYAGESLRLAMLKACPQEQESAAAA